MKWYNEDEETAKANVPRAQNAVEETEEEGGEFGEGRAEGEEGEAEE